MKKMIETFFFAAIAFAVIFTLGLIPQEKPDLPANPMKENQAQFERIYGTGSYVN